MLTPNLFAIKRCCFIATRELLTLTAFNPTPLIKYGGDVLSLDWVRLFEVECFADLLWIRALLKIYLERFFLCALEPFIGIPNS